MNRIVKLGLVGALALTVATGCSYRSVDAEQTGATQVPGTGVLHRFCDQSTLIYVSIVPNEDDNFEAFFYGGCAWDAKTNQFLPAIGANTKPRTSPTDPNTDENNQQDERDEDN